jgi:hypothetical protein
MDFVWFMSFKRLGTCVDARGWEINGVCVAWNETGNKSKNKTNKQKKSMMLGHY